jgi:alanine-glyoxylate transaminase/(R)-3-amino-2-methylpropionate-pyruvate transaminase
MGTHYWGFESEGVVPDIVTMAKGIGNGAPLAAVVTTPEIAAVLSARIHFNTFGGNPVSSAIGQAVIATIDEDKLQENSLTQGKLFKDGLLEIKKKYPQVVGDVRGRGLMLGLDLVKDPKTKEGDKQAATDVMEFCKDHQLLVGRGGYFGNVIRIKPPMCISSDDVKYALAIIEAAIASLKR